MAVQESIGHIVDREQELLGTSAVAIVQMRRRMLESLERSQRKTRRPARPDAVGASAQRAADHPDPFQPWQSVGSSRPPSAGLQRALAGPRLEVLVNRKEV